VKVSAKSMEKLGFQRFGNVWQHRSLQNLRFAGLPAWESIVERSVKYGVETGKSVAIRDIKKALDITN
jgi:hypothetical protein